MSFRKHFDKLQGQFDKVMDRLDSPKPGSAPPAVPSYSRPGQYPGQYVPPPGQYSQGPYPPPGQYTQSTQGAYNASPYPPGGYQSQYSPGGQPYGYPGGQYQQPVPHSGYYGPPPIPNHPQGQQESPYQSVPTPDLSSKPGSTGPPPPPLSSKPSGSAPPPYQADHNSSYYWNPTFSPEIPVSEHFDYDLGAGGWGNNELQTYTSYPPNAFHTPQHTLVVRAIVDKSKSADRDKYTSARLLSKQRLARRRGYVSAVLSAPCARGIWPAFWMLPEEPFEWPTDGEIDIFEAWNGGVENHSCLHWGGYSDPQDKNKHRTINTNMRDVTVPHEYGLAWEQDEYGGEGGRLIWYIDGRAVMKAQRPPGTRRLESWRVLLNIAMGGTVCDGCVPENGSYDMTISRLSMGDLPPGGWERFEIDYHNCREGRPL
ncbi:concanavalin A-like lectin/glucanase [Microthyrium microscopicum]|uniref:Concanavalin A-like lectin/glucanase n=1 Tax=Microthyrium microscopicum TaxID=703497 RepID=A0A6A6UQ58_9PEZI|nr:concanavalin A-like lectin/glucanase [Microthyrium microscopicum]